MIFRRDIPWPQLFLEGVAIVVSILLAFWIDAWWDGRQELKEEREILLGLEAEFVDLRERLDFWAGVNREGARLVAQYLSEEVGQMDHLAADNMFTRVNMVNVLDQGGALDALLASGRLEKIADRDIRLRLAKWPDWLEDIHTNDLSIRDYAMREITPYLAEHGIPQTVCPEGEWTCADEGPIPEHYVVLAADKRLRALLINRRTMMWLIAEDHENASDEADQIIDMIRARLAVLAN